MKRGNLWPLCTAGGPLALAPPLSAYTQRDRRRLQVFTANALFMPPSRAVERTRDGGREAERSGERNFITHRIFWWRSVHTTNGSAAQRSAAWFRSETWSGVELPRRPNVICGGGRGLSRHEVILMRTNLIFLSFPYSSPSLLPSFPPSAENLYVTIIFLPLPSIAAAPPRRRPHGSHLCSLSAEDSP